MPYRTVMRFSDPERLVIELAEPGRGSIRHDIRLGGIGADGAHRFIETDEGPGRPPRRFRLDHIRAATRPDGSTLDIREAILDAHDWESLRRGEVPEVARRDRMGEYVIGIAIALGVAAVAVGAGLVSGDTALGHTVFVLGLVAIGVGALACAVPGLLAGFGGLFRRRR